jgi:phosphatidylserine/phosphatidylglycerophosphate/cardiolipin synthase-like enzyme
MNLDQTRPLNFSQQKRNCHIKFMAVDDQVGIIGNGNMDSQSWYHSQVNQQKNFLKKNYLLLTM